MIHMRFFFPTKQDGEKKPRDLFLETLPRRDDKVVIDGETYHVVDVRHFPSPFMETVPKSHVRLKD